MLASKTWKRSEVPAKRYSPSYNSSINSSLPKPLLKHNGLIQKNVYILYLFQIIETARPKDQRTLLSVSVTVKMPESISTHEISFKLVFPRTACADSLYFDFYVFGIAKIFFTAHGGVGSLHMCTTCSSNSLKACALLYKQVIYDVT